MSYKSLLFCPDDKTARVVTQVLSELEFQVELCNEPFAAVKKLMAEHFDAVVVDCENEQNASLLFKSARNSGSNQTSLSVAVVEGQSGVAKAFRIGANLVLTKPINVEQSKGTLRVARGLLRKSETGKPAVPASHAGPADFGSASPSGTKPTIPSPAFTTPPAASIAPTMTASTSSVFELEKEPEVKPEPTEAALLESMSDPGLGKTTGSDSADKTAAPKQYPWQPIQRPMAEPMASALKHAAEATGKSEVATSTGQDSPSTATFSGAVSAHGGAAAAAPAKEDVPAEEAEPTVEPPAFTMSFEASRGSGSGSGMKILAIAAVVLIAAAAGYFGWTKMHPAGPSAKKQLAPTAIPAAVTPALAVPATAPAVADAITPAPASAEVIATPLPPAAEKNPVATDTPATPKKSVPKNNTNTIAPVNSSKPVVDTGSEDALVVKGGSAPQVKQAPVAQDEEKAPDVSSVAANSNDNAISGLVNAPASVPNATPQTLKVSQGVSQGLLVKKVPPVYPPQAMQMRIQGSVQLTANIGTDGSITSVKLVSGDPVLAHAAIDAVKQWKYKPYYLDGQPVEIQTQITVNFKLP